MFSYLFLLILNVVTIVLPSNRSVFPIFVLTSTASIQQITL